MCGGLFLAVKSAIRLAEPSFHFKSFCPRVQPCPTAADKGGVCKRSIRELQGDSAGTVFVEYTILLVLVGVVASAAIFAIGMPLVSRYQFMKLLIALPLP